MARVLDMNEGKRRLAAKKGFDPWSRRFRTSLDEDTSIRQLDDSVIRYLVQGGEDSAMALYELIMGIRGLGPGTRFHYLDSASKMSVTDITLFLLDLDSLRDNVPAGLARGLLLPGSPPGGPHPVFQTSVFGSQA